MDTMVEFILEVDGDEISKFIVSGASKVSNDNILAVNSSLYYTTVARMDNLVNRSS